MRNSFPSRDSLCVLPLERLRLVEIKEPDEEALVQEIIDAKVAKIPVMEKVYIGDVPDIKTPEQEKEWQSKIDERAAKIKRKYVKHTAEATVAPELAPEPINLPPVAPELIETSTAGAPNTELPSTTASKRFCETCDSKGGIHLKGCPNKKI